MECIKIFDIGGSYPYHCGYTSTSRHGLKVSIKSYHNHEGAQPELAFSQQDVLMRGAQSHLQLSRAQKS